MKIFVTGASGFIGSAFVARALEHSEHSIVAMIRDSDRRNLARLYQGERGRIIGQAEKLTGRLRLINGDLNGDLSGATEGCDAVVNFAARTFVDHSIRDPWPFIQANVIGTYRILEDARKNAVKYFIQVSTDEVYGAIPVGAYAEDARINPTNPYAASKAGADALVISYAHTFGMWTAVTRTENNYGPFQHPQKVFPAFVKKALAGEQLPVYGDGKHRRQWLWVDDHCDAILLLLQRIRMTADFGGLVPGQVFHIAGSQELENLDLARKILDGLQGLGKVGLKATSGSKDWHFACIKFIEDHNVRPGHDRRYALVCDKMKKLGWEPKVSLDDGIKRAVKWYAENSWWLT